ncbi:MAG: L,D-transpeptidase family protein, partial [Sphingobium yanoikuyae]|nr:L,D-transpeptidase family protein [Sphingobium yanoikuyae]
MLVFGALAGLPTQAALAQSASAPDAAARSGVAAEVRAQVGGKFRDFYGPRGYWPLWIEADRMGPQAGALLALIEGSEADGLRPRDYDLRGLQRLIDQANDGRDPKALARAEIALSRAFTDLVADMRRPSRAVRIRYLDPEVEPKTLDPSEILRAAALAPSLAEYIETAGWMDPLYMRLRHARAAYLADWGGLPAVSIPENVRLRPGMKGDLIPVLRHRLGLGDGTTYDKALVARVKAFQGAHGLKADGIAGAQTLEALNRGPSWYEQKIALNQERARLLPGPWVKHVVVDAASARLWYYDGGALDGTMKVVVGTKETQTPMMAGMVRYGTLNPYWNIPPDLVQNKVAPRILGGASLTRLNYEALSDWTANPRPLVQSQVDWSAVAAGQQEVRIRQLPGGSNAMGKVKFMFPNDLGIYLHDTPQRELFAKPVRHFSNGCVRLEDAQR